MNCERYRELLPAQHEGHLPTEDAEAFETHGGTCAECRDYSADYATFERLLHEIAADDVGEAPPALDEMLRAAGIPAQRKAVPSGRVVPLWRRHFGWIAAAAVALIAVAAWRLVPREATVDRVEARLYANQTVGRLPPGATIQIFKAGTSKVFHDLGLLQMPGSRSLNNLALRERQLDRVVQTDGSGRIALPGGLAEPRLVRIEKPGYLATWGVVEPLAGDPALTRDVALYPSRAIHVSGTLVDASSNEPIPNAWVATLDGTGTAKTDENGRYAGTFQFTARGTPRLRAQANGFDDVTVVVADGKERFEWAAGLTPALRQTADVTVLDADGRPVAGAVAIAIPAPADDAQRNAIPPERRDRPEVAVSDENGRLGLVALYDCPYRLEFLHGRVGADGELFYPHQAKTIRLRPDGDSHVRVHTYRGDKPVPTRIVLAPRPKDGTRATGFLEGSTDAGGLIRFASLDDGPGSLRIYSREGHQFAVEFLMTPASQIECEYEMPACSLPLDGTVTGFSGADRLVTLRLEGTLAPIAIGAAQSTAHTLVTETPVEADGSFRFPALPTMQSVRLLGRQAADPHGPLVPLRATPSLDALLGPGGRGGTTRIAR